MRFRTLAGLSLFLTVMLFQMGRGLSLDPSPYPLSLTLFSYFDGPIRRGLLPTLLELAGRETLAQKAEALALLHFAALALLACVLGGLAAWRLKTGGMTDLRFLLLCLFVASPVLPVLAAVNGYADPWMALVLFAEAGLLFRGRFGQAALVMLAGVLLHEILLVFSLPLWVVFLCRPSVPKAALAVFAGALILVFGHLCLASTLQPGLVPLAEQRCTDFRPADNPLVFVWDDYCTFQMSGSLSGLFAPARLLLLPVYGMGYGVFPLLLLCIWAGLARQSGFRPALPLLIGFGLPYSLVTVAWDTDRMFVLSSVAGFLATDLWLAGNRNIPPVRPVHAGLLLCLGLLQLLLHYPAIDVYGVNRLVPPAVARSVFVDPRWWIVQIGRAHV